MRDDDRDLLRAVFAKFNGSTRETVREKKSHASPQKIARSGVKRALARRHGSAFDFHFVARFHFAI